MKLSGRSAIRNGKHDVRLLLRPSQYFNKYCTSGKGTVSISMRWGLVSKLLGWWQGSSAEGLAIGAGVDERLVKGLSKEVEGFSGREVMYC